MHHAMQFNHHLVLALDDVEPSAAVTIARSLMKGIDAVKVGWPLVLSAGTVVVGKVADVVPVICDFKVADIPAVDEMIEDAVDEAEEYANSEHESKLQDFAREWLKNWEENK